MAVVVEFLHAAKLMVLGYDGRRAFDGALGANPYLVSLLEGIFWGLSHLVYEGTAVLLCQKGCGINAFCRTLILAGVWGLVTAIIVTWHYSSTSNIAAILMTAWSCVLVVGYGLIWLLPLCKFYRRPAAIRYAAVHCISRVMLLTSVAMVTAELDAGWCLQMGSYSLLFGIALPFAMRYALFQDSGYWLGNTAGHVKSGTGDDKNGFSALSEVLLESQMPSTPDAGITAQSLAEALDEHRPNMIPEYKIRLPPNALLGTGGTAKVYRGSWVFDDTLCIIRGKQGRDVAVKVLVCPELTPTGPLPYASTCECSG